MTFTEGINGQFFRHVTITAATVIASTSIVILCDTTSNAITINLPPVLNNKGTQYWIKNIGAAANNVTLDGNSSETIDGSATYALADGKGVIVYCDGSVWRRIALF